MVYRNESLYSAVEAYVRAALEFIANEARTQAISSELREDNFFFTRIKSAGDLAELPEYRACLEALIGDPLIAGQLDVMAGTNSRRSRAPSAEQLMNRILDLGINGGRYEFDAEHFGREYAAFEEAYYSPDILYEVVAPLQGLLIDNPVRLSDDLEIDHLKEGELNRERRPGGGATSGDPLRAKLCAVRTSCRLPKVVGDNVEIDREARQKDDAKRREANDRVERVVSALRLCGIESVFPTAIIHRTNRWSFGYDHVFPGRFRPDIHFSMQAGGPWLSSFEQFWDGLQSERVQKRRFIDTAVRRYSYAHERHRLEDKIVDLLIAAESLFLSDYKKDDPYIGEIRYRMSPLAPLFFGGGQERGLRPGTLPVPLIAGLGLAAELALRQAGDRAAHCREFRTNLLEALKPLEPVINGDPERASPHVLNISFLGVDSEALMVALKDCIAVSNGSACTSQSYQPSHVLKAMGLPESVIKGAVRISWCHMTEAPDWNEVVSIINKLR